MANRLPPESSGVNPATLSIMTWFLFHEGSESLIEDHKPAAARELVLSCSHDDEAAEKLKGWFSDLFVYDPGLPTPFADLAIQFIEDGLARVDWPAVIRMVREDLGRGEKGSAPADN